MKHLVLVLYAGDFLEATRRRDAGLADRYRHHTYALSTLSAIRSAGARVTVVQRNSSEPYAHTENGIHFLGLGRSTDKEASAALASYLQAEAVTHFALCFPSSAILSGALGSRARVGLVLADSFPSRFRRARQYRRLGQLLRAPQVDFVANHQTNSSRQLVDVLHVPPAKVVPWDWPLDLVAVARSNARSHPAEAALRLCYVGTISGSKGVWDLLAAVQRLRRHGEDVSLVIAGEGETDEMWARTRRYGVEAHIRYLGCVDGDEVLAMMRSSSFVCVPSRPAYPEGLPLTIYEAMASGTPLVASDHPMFRGVIRDGVTGFVFRAGSSARLAATIRHAWKDTAAYARVSTNAVAYYPRLGLPTLWGDVLEHWVGGTPGDAAYLAHSSLAHYSVVGRGRE